MVMVLSRRLVVREVADDLEVIAARSPVGPEGSNH